MEYLIRASTSINQTGPDMTTPAPETVIVNDYRVACDGGVGGHPRVWLQISNEHGWVECPYCDAKMVHKDFEGKV
jgi:uncharacterized Zn-finger protein